MPAEKKKKKRKFTIKQLKFIKNYLKTGNGAEAVRRAGYKAGSKGGSKTKRQKQVTESVIGVQNLKKLNTELDKYFKKQKIDINWVLKRLVNKADLSRNEMIQLKALELIGKNKKMFTDKVEHSGGIEKKVKIYLPEKKG
jgi:phage terminase small subunit